ncbi:MAG: hypothetical protein N2C13_02785 [Chloroflexota bacterium]
MFKSNINAIVAKALLDQEFKAAILNGHRKDKLNEFGLNDQQKAAVMAIKANNLDQFIHRVDKLIQQPSFSA